MNTGNEQVLFQRSSPHNPRRKWKMRCPKCGGYYYVELLESYEFEICPFGCGYKGGFESFVVYEVGS